MNAVMSVQCPRGNCNVLRSLKVSVFLSIVHFRRAMVYFRRSGTGARGTKKTCSFCLQEIAKIEQTNLKTNSRARLITALKSYFGHELLLHHVLVQSTELNRRMVLTD